RPPVFLASPVPPLPSPPRLAPLPPRPPRPLSPSSPLSQPTRDVALMVAPKRRRRVEERAANFIACKLSESFGVARGKNDREAAVDRSLWQARRGGAPRSEERPVASRLVGSPGRAEALIGVHEGT